MPDRLAELDAALDQLVRQVMKESDPLKYEKLCAEIRSLLDERERLQRPGSPNEHRPNHPPA